MTLPEFDFRTSLNADRLGTLREVTHRLGCFRIRHPLFSAERCGEMLGDAHRFFHLPAEEKRRVAIERSPHFRGYSVMRNQRDWREQVHFGREEEARSGSAPYERLRGPNLWPADSAWKQSILRLMHHLEQAAAEVLRALAMSLDFAPSRFLGESESPYLVMKLIHYQPLPDCEPRLGVAPHVDFSWITLLLQDDAGGLEFRSPDGVWQTVRPLPGTLVVNVGEILDSATGGYFAATPHRVINGTQSRISVPFFLNPGLDTWIEPGTIGSGSEFPPVPEGGPGHDSHVHRVFASARGAAFRYGDEEWKRKGLNVYCQACVPDPSRNAPVRA